MLIIHSFIILLALISVKSRKSFKEVGYIRSVHVGKYLSKGNKNEIIFIDEKNKESEFTIEPISGTKDEQGKLFIFKTVNHDDSEEEEDSNMLLTLDLSAKDAKISLAKKDGSWKQKAQFNYITKGEIIIKVDKYCLGTENKVKQAKANVKKKCKKNGKKEKSEENTKIEEESEENSDTKYIFTSVNCDLNDDNIFFKWIPKNGGKNHNNYINGNYNNSNYNNGNYNMQNNNQNNFNNGNYNMQNTSPNANGFKQNSSKEAQPYMNNSPYQPIRSNLTGSIAPQTNSYGGDYSQWPYYPYQIYNYNNTIPSNFNNQETGKPKKHKKGKRNKHSS